MENPYSTELLTEPANKSGFDRSGFLARVWIALIPTGVIAANYTTATTIPRELWDVFAHVVFLVAPVSLLIHVPNLIASFHGKMPSIPRWSFLVLLLIPASFLVSISPYFSINPYEGFVVMNRYFGPYGWILWTWLIALGILPLLELILAIRRSRWTMMLLSSTAIGFHIHNAYWVWWICHIKA